MRNADSNPPARPPRRVPPAWLGCGLIFALALGARLGYQLRFEREIGVDFTRHPELDEHTFHATALRIVEGDLLARHVLHPYHWWYRRIAPEETFLGWYPRGCYHQSPLYPYFVAAVYGVCGPHPRAVRRVQAGLGAATAALVFLLGSAVFTRGVGLAAGLLAALYGPAVFFESTLLRAGLLTFLAAGLLLALVRASTRGGGLAWALSGGLFGLSILAKPTAAAFLPVALVVLAARERRGGRGLRRPALLVAALALSLAPLVGRNLAVGAPPLSMTTRGPFAFVNGNARGSTGTGWFPPETRAVVLGKRAPEILRRSEGRFLPTILATLATHRGDPLGYLGLLGRKAAAFFDAYEIPNNVDFHAVRRTVPWLAALPTFSLVGPLALLGIALALGRREALLLHLFGATMFLATIAFFVVSRFRLPVMPVLWIFAAHALGRVAGWARRRRWRPLIAGGVALAVVALVIRPGGRVPSRAAAAVRIGDIEAAVEKPFRAQERYDWASRGENGGSPRDRLTALARLGAIRLRMGGASGLISRFRAILREDLDPRDAAIAHLQIGNILYRRGRPADALAEFEEAGRLDPDNPMPPYLIARARWDGGRGEAALGEARRCVEVEPDFAGGHALLGEILLGLGRGDEGRRELEAALEIGFEDPSLEARAREVLERGGGGGEE